MVCEICGREDNDYFHHCSPVTLARIESRYRREEQAAEENEELVPTTEERLELGFAMIEGKWV